jgi:hypothetical protein
MARTNIVAQTLAGAYPVTPLAGASADIAFIAGDVGNGNETPLVDSKTVVIAYNTSVGSARTITFTSVVDTLNRLGDITAYSVGIGVISRFGAFKTVGWAHSGKLWIDVSNAELTLAVITLP